MWGNVRDASTLRLSLAAPKKKNCWGNVCVFLLSREKKKKNNLTSFYNASRRRTCVMREYCLTRIASLDAGKSAAAKSREGAICGRVVFFLTPLARGARVRVMTTRRRKECGKKERREAQGQAFLSARSEQ